MADSFVEMLADAKLASQEAMRDVPADAKWFWCDHDGRPLIWPADKRHRTLLELRRIRANLYIDARARRKRLARRRELYRLRKGKK